MARIAANSARSRLHPRMKRDASEQLALDRGTPAVDSPAMVQVVNTLSRSDGGPARHALEVNFALNNAGAKVQLLSVHPETDDCVLGEMRDRVDFPELSPQFLRPATLRSYGRRLMQVARSERLILHGYFLWWVPVLTAWARLCNVPVFVMPHGALTAYDRSKSRAKKNLFVLLGGGWLVDRVARFVVASEMELSELPRTIARSRVNVVGAGAEPPESTPDVSRPLNNPVRLLTLSRVAPKKRIDLAISAVAKLRDAGVDAELVVAGTGLAAHLQELKRLASADGVESQVTFSGAVGGTDKAELLRWADIFVLPSEDENFGLALAEAAMHAIPAVVSDRVGAAMHMPSSAGARLTAPTPTTIADAVRALAGRYGSARKSAREFARAEFSWTEVGARWMTALGAQTQSASAAPSTVPSEGR